LCAHTLLGRTMQRADAFDAEAFDRGVAIALSSDGAAGPLSTIFSCRTLGLTGQLSGTAQPDYLSGLLIGHELAALASLLSRVDEPLPPIILIGSPTLCSRYQRALTTCGFARVEQAEQATERGLWQVAVEAGLLAPIHKEV